MREPCRSCRAPVVWAVAETGRRMPFDPDPRPDGEWRLAASPAGRLPRAVHVPEARRAALAGELLAPHWASCPDADRWRRRR